MITFWAKLQLAQGAGCDRIFKLMSVGVAKMSDRCWHLVNELTNFTPQSKTDAKRKQFRVSLKILFTNKNFPCGKGIKCSALGVRRSKVSDSQDQNRSQKSISAVCLKNCPKNFNQTWQAHFYDKCPFCQQLGCKCKRCRLHEAEDSFGCLPEASFSRLLARVAFLVCILFCCSYLLI